MDAYCLYRMSYYGFKLIPVNPSYIGKINLMMDSLIRKIINISIFRDKIMESDICTRNRYYFRFVLWQIKFLSAFYMYYQSAEIFYQIKRDICMTCLLISIYKKSFEVLCFPCISTFAITKQPVVVVVNNENLLDVNHEIVFLGSAYSLIFLIPIYTPLYILLHFHQSH